MSNFEGSADRGAQHALWIATTLARHFDKAGEPVSPDASYHLHIALDALEDDASARAVARFHAARQPQGSTAGNALTDWCTLNLLQHDELPTVTRLEELAKSTDFSRPPQIQLGLELLLAATTPAETPALLRFASLQLDQHTGLRPLICSALDHQAEQLAESCVDCDLFTLARLAHVHQLPALRKATTAQLPRAGLSQLERWHAEARREDQPELAQDLSQAYLTGLTELAAAEPREAWGHLARLQERWNNGLPVIIRESDAPTRAVFNGLAQSEPIIASYETAQQICASPSAPERLHRLAGVQEDVATMPLEPQLVFLGELHKRLMFEPDLVRPSRQQILTLATAAASPALTNRLYAMAVGDDVLQRQLKPTPPAQPPTATPGPLRRTLSCLRSLLP